MNELLVRCSAVQIAACRELAEKQGLSADTLAFLSKSREGHSCRLTIEAVQF